MLRGSTRNDKGGEELAYFKGGFGRLAEALVSAIRANGSEVVFNSKVTGLVTAGKQVTAVTTEEGEVAGNKFCLRRRFH